MIVFPGVLVQFINNLINKLFPSCVNLLGERFFREESEILSAADDFIATTTLGSISALLSGPSASPRRDFSEVSAGLFPEVATGNRAYHYICLGVNPYQRS